MVLESYRHARARRAKILAYLSGYAATCDAYHITAPREDGEGVARCLRTALIDAGISPLDVGYINAHGIFFNSGRYRRMCCHFQGFSEKDRTFENQFDKIDDRACPGSRIGH